MIIKGGGRELRASWAAGRPRRGRVGGGPGGAERRRLRAAVGLGGSGDRWCCPRLGGAEGRAPRAPPAAPGAGGFLLATLRGSSALRLVLRNGEVSPGVRDFCARGPGVLFWVFLLFFFFSPRGL